MGIEPLQEIFRETFKDSNMILTKILSAKDVKGWDSFAHIALLIAIEDKFGITFSTEEMVSFANVGELVNLLQSKGVDINW